MGSDLFEIFNQVQDIIGGILPESMCHTVSTVRTARLVKLSDRVIRNTWKIQIRQLGIFLSKSGNPNRKFFSWETWSWETRSGSWDFFYKKEKHNQLSCLLEFQSKDFFFSILPNWAFASLLVNIFSSWLHFPGKMDLIIIFIQPDWDYGTSAGGYFFLLASFVWRRIHLIFCFCWWIVSFLASLSEEGFIWFILIESAKMHALENIRCIQFV